jgi:hypothetical protein
MSNVDASPATRKLYECMLLVESCGASPELTTAIGALGELDVLLHADAAALAVVRAEVERLEAENAQLRAQFQAETLTTSFLALRLVGDLCDRCHERDGAFVYANDAVREWLCVDCAGQR